MVVQWDVALTKDRDRVWITDITDDWDEALFCPECDGVMIPVRGRLVQHHFRHSVESNCSGESAKHWAKKYEIADALEGIGLVIVEGNIGNYVADVLFEDDWAFEVVFSNPPSEDKLRDLREKLVVFNFNDDRIWSPDGNPVSREFYDYDDQIYDYDDQSFKRIVSSLGRSIVSGETVDVCSVCREVKGASSRLKAGGKCMKCDFTEFTQMRANQTLDEYLLPAREKFDEYWKVEAIRERYESQSAITKTYAILALVGWIYEYRTDRLRFPKSAKIIDSQEIQQMHQFEIEANKLGHPLASIVSSTGMQEKIYGSVEAFEESVNTLWNMINGMVDELAEEIGGFPPQCKETLSEFWGLSRDFHPPTIGKKKKKLWKEEKEELTKKYNRQMRKWGKFRG